MSEISLFTSVTYHNQIENPPVTGWCAKQLDHWTFPFFGSKIEVIEFDGNKVARYREDTTKSNLLEVACRILLFATVVFSLIVLIARAILRQNIEFKKFEPPKPKPEVPSLRAIQSNQENQVPVGKPFSIELWHSWTTGHKPWEISQLPSFIKHLNKHVKSQNPPPDPDICGSGTDHVFVFEPKEPGRGDIVMRLPDLSGSDARTVEERFTIIAG